MSDCEHDWKVEEQGYIRTWHTEIDPQSKVIVAYFNGSEDWSDEGDGILRLVCSTCLETQNIPEDWEVNFS